MTSTIAPLDVLVVLEARGPMPAGFAPLPIMSVVVRALESTGRFGSVTTESLATNAIACVQILGHTDAKVGAALAVRVLLAMDDGTGEESHAFIVPADDAEGVLVRAHYAATSLGTTRLDLMATSTDSANPAFVGFLAVTAARRVERSALAMYGAQLVELAPRTRETNELTLGLECQSFGGDPRGAALGLIAALSSGWPADARIRRRAGGLRAWMALGEARLAGSVTWLAREVARMEVDPNARSPVAFGRVSELLGRLKRLGILPLEADPHAELAFTLRGRWVAEFLPDTLGGSMTRLARLVAAVVRGEELPSPPPRLALESLLGEPCLDVPTAHVARAIFSRPESLDPFFTDTAWALARACMRTDDLAGAEAHFRATLRVRPGDGEVIESLADIYLRTGRGPEAIELLRSATGPGRVNCATIEAGLAIDAGNLARGIAGCDAALDRDPLHPNARVFRARARKLVGDARGAAEDAAIARALYLNVEDFLRESGL